MASTRKYAGLPDLDIAPEIYETPDLTEDGSTEQTSTLRTESPAPSDDGRQNENLVRTRLNQEEARARFEPAVVYTNDINLSDAVGGTRKGYRTSHRRRHRRLQLEDEGGDLEDLIGGESDYEEETLSKKLARLRREAEEVRLELARREREGEIFKDSLEHQQNADMHEDDKDLMSGIEDLNRALAGLKTSSRATRGQMLEQEFGRRLADEKSHQQNGNKTKGEVTESSKLSSSSPSASITAIAAFSDRLTALETALGLSAVAPSTATTSILPTLDILTSQIGSLRNTISPANSVLSNTQKDHIDVLTSRLHTLHADADSLLNTRKAAMQALAQIHESRYRSNNSAVFARYLTRRDARQRDSLEAAGAGNTAAIDEEVVVATGGIDGGNTTTSGLKPRDPRRASRTSSHHHADAEPQLYTDLFLEEQSTKIAALHNTLPTIQSLQPLLPLVLDRLRTLSVIHASASTAHEDMTDIEQRLQEWESETKKWRDAVVSVESGIKECEGVMKGNLDVVQEIVKGLEERMDKLMK